MFCECVVHIGTEKTGSTAIQNALADGWEMLLARGWLYPETPGQRLAHLGLVVYCRDEGWKYAGSFGRERGIESKRDWERFLERFPEDLEREFSSRQAARMIVSSEHFHSGLQRRYEIERLRDLLGRWCERFRVVVYLRRQDRVAVSWYSTLIKESGLHRPIFAARDDGYYFNYLELYENWAAVFGENAMVVRIYEEARRGEGGVVGDFIEVCGLERDAVPIERAQGANPSLSRVGIDFLRAVRAIGGEELWQRWRGEAVRYAETRWRGKAALATREEAMAFYARFREENEELARRLGRESLFDEDFSEYPEALPECPPEYYEAVEAAAEHFVRLARHTPEGQPLYGKLGPHPVVEWGPPKGRIELAEALKEMAAGEERRVNVRVANESRGVWPAGGEHPVRLAYHWVKPSGEMVVFDGLRTPLPGESLGPRESVTVEMGVRAPDAPGRYVLVATLVWEGRFWFEQRSDRFAPARCEVEVREAGVCELSAGSDAVAGGL